MATLDLPEDVRRSLAEARDRLKLDPFASPVDVIKKLTSLHLPVPAVEPPMSPSLTPMRRSAGKKKDLWPPRKTWIIGGRPIDSGQNQADQFGNALRALEELNPQFLSKFGDYCISQAGEGGRAWVSQNRDSLYPGRPKLIGSQSREVPGFAGWWFGTNYSKEKKRDIIKLACRMVGAAFKEGPLPDSTDKMEGSIIEPADADQALHGAVQRDYYLKCWFIAFYSQGGTLERKKGVEDLVYNQIKGVLAPKDYETIPSGNPNYKSDIRWRKDVEWCHHQMVRRGWIESVSRGLWKLTPAGVEEAERIIGQK